MAAVVMYCTATCPYCQAAQRLLEKKGVTDERTLQLIGMMREVFCGVARD